jgi:hypothetical protein
MHVAGDDGSRLDHCPSPDTHSFEDSGIRTDPDIILDYHWDGDVRWTWNALA